MNTILEMLKRTSLVRTLLSLAVLLGAFACPQTPAGPIPFTQNQYPVFYATQTTPVSITNAAETDLAIIPVPPNFMGNSGYCKLTVIADGDAGTTNHVLTLYLGGLGHTNATALATNTYKTTVST